MSTDHREMWFIDCSCINVMPSHPLCRTQVHLGLFFIDCLCIAYSDYTACIHLLMHRYFHKQGVKGEESLEQIVPTLSDFCDYVEK